MLFRIYDYMRAHRWTTGGMLVATTLLLLLAVLRLSYKEDISAFLPLDSQHQRAMQVYQDISGANKLFAIFQYRDTTRADADAMVAAIDDFVARVGAADTAHVLNNVVSRIDLEQLSSVSDFVYQNIPYFLTDADYTRMDSLLAQPDFAHWQLQQDKQLLMFPSGGLLTDNIGRDPLNLFTPTVAKLQGSAAGMRYEMYDGCIFSEDMSRAVVIISSPYGSSETEHNGQILQLLRACADTTCVQAPNIDIHLTGGPAIAVGNAQQIKADSLVSVALAAVLILALLLLTFRNVRNLLLIALSIAWGWLFAMGGLALVHDSVSIIVLGISSVILGIAVNYPLHFLAHLTHTPDKRQALHEIVMPLVVGNVTTVGAFLALVPLESTALRDLGLFASFLLVGTIVFVLLFLPHLSRAPKAQHRATFLDRLGEIRLENKRWVVVVVVVFTIVFGYFSQFAGFDTNMSHINYMTDEQRADMEFFAQQMLAETEASTVYAVSTGQTIDEALDKSQKLQPHLTRLQQEGVVQKVNSCADFLTSKAEQARRLARWRTFVAQHSSTIQTALLTEGAKEGFASDSFDDFLTILDAAYAPQSFSYFAPLAETTFAANLCRDAETGEMSVIDVVTTAKDKVEAVEQQLDKQASFTFDVASMNSAIANHLSDDFNYIGWACGCIVFFFLWLSMGSLELAILSFVPMAVSWVWILGIMGLLGWNFNIVNVILATFIFGQGDDYTIFMTEGACYEYAYRRKMLASYKHSIIVSALIMFIGIGTLIVAKHPALHSLAELTVAGMFSVVLMAYIFPPLIFRWLVERGGKYRCRPLSLTLLWETLQERFGAGRPTEREQCRRLARDRYRYKGVDIFRAVKRSLRDTAFLDNLSQKEGRVVFPDAGYGERALLYALLHPTVEVIATEADDEKARVARFAAESVAPNMVVRSALRSELSASSENSGNSEKSNGNHERKDKNPA